MDNRIPALDGVRGVAVLMILVHHGIYFTPSNTLEVVFEQITGGWNAWGWIGVDLFFVLSGYLITGILLKSREQPNYLRNFYARRSLRIFPLYFASLAVCFFLLPTSWQETLRVKQEDQIWYWTYSMNIYYGVTGSIPLWMSHFWSLCIEEHFYLVWPLIVLCFSRRLPWICAGIIVGSAGLRVGLYCFGWKPLAAYCFTFTRMDGLTLGALIACLEQSGQLLAIRKYCMAAFLGLAIYLVVLGVICAGLHPLSWKIIIFGITPVGFLWGAAMVVLITSSPDSWLARLLSRREFTVPGKYSYSLYVLHMPVLCFLHGALAESDELGLMPTVGGTQIPVVVLQVVLLIGLSLIVAAISYHSFEVHFLNLKKYFTVQNTRPALEVPMGSTNRDNSDGETDRRAA